MGNNSWIVDNLNNALNTWNSKLAEIWQLLTQSPQIFKGGGVWAVMVSIHGALQAIGYGLLVLFFAAGVVRTCGSFVEVKKPEHALKLFVRFALAKGAVTYGLDLMLAVYDIIQGMVTTVINRSGVGGMAGMTLPQELVDLIASVGFWDSIPLSSFAGEPSANVGKNFLRSYAGVCLQGVVIALACIIFSTIAVTDPAVDSSVSAVTAVWSYVGELVFNLLILVGAIKGCDRIVKEIMGL